MSETYHIDLFDYIDRFRNLHYLMLAQECLGLGRAVGGGLELSRGAN